jgi:methyl-accepting chemotaxis protein
MNAAIEAAHAGDAGKGFAETMSSFINTFNELSAKSASITDSLVSLKEQSSAVKTSYAQLIEMTGKLTTAMKELSDLSKG